MGGDSNTPFANTPDAFPVLHHGFDTLTVSIKANLPPAAMQTLESARFEAEREPRTVVAEIDRHRFKLSGHGGAGYALFDLTPEEIALLESAV